MRVIRIERPAWFAEAACRGKGPEHWFPASKHSTQAARTTCAECPVRPECLAHALADASLVGIWGGTSETERDRIRTRRNA